MTAAKGETPMPEPGPRWRAWAIQHIASLEAENRAQAIALKVVEESELFRRVEKAEADLAEQKGVNGMMAALAVALSKDAVAMALKAAEARVRELEALVDRAKVLMPGWPPEEESPAPAAAPLIPEKPEDPDEGGTPT